MSKNKGLLRRLIPPDLLLGSLVCILFLLLYSLLVLHKYWQFEYFYVDNVYFHSAISKLARLEAPVVIHQHEGEINMFGDHLSPAIFLIALIYRPLPFFETILVSMVVLYVVGGFFGVLIARYLKLPLYFWAPLLLCYFLFIGTQNAFLFGFHEINLIPAFFMMAAWALLTKRKTIFWLSLLVLLLTKESMPAIGLGIGWFMLFSLRHHRKRALLVIALSLVWLVLAIKVIIPYFSGDGVLYTKVELPQTPEALVHQLTTPTEKITTFLVTLGSFGFMPLLSVSLLPLVIQDFLLRYVFSISGSIQYTLYYHYGVAVAPILFFASLWVSFKLINRQGGKWLVALLVMVSLSVVFYSQVFLEQRAPIFLTFNKAFYQQTKNNAFLWQLIKEVPATGTVMAQNHLGAALANREATYLLPHDSNELKHIDPDLIVYELRPGQNPNNFFPISLDEWTTLTKELIETGKYRVVYNHDLMYVLEKSSDRI